MLYHIPIAFVRDCMSVEAGCTSIGEKIREDKDNRSSDKRLINLHFAISLAADEKQRDDRSYVDFMIKVFSSRSLRKVIS